jgi:hypothetical protein
MGHLPMPESDMSVVQQARLPQLADDVARKHNIFKYIQDTADVPVFERAKSWCSNYCISPAVLTCIR